MRPGVVVRIVNYACGVGQLIMSCVVYGQCRYTRSGITGDEIYLFYVYTALLISVFLTGEPACPTLVMLLPTLLFCAFLTRIPTKLIVLRMHSGELQRRKPTHRRSNSEPVSHHFCD